MAFTMACPNFEKGLKMLFGLSGVKKGCFKAVLSLKSSKNFRG
jgi:hypothetical protein